MNNSSLLLFAKFNTAVSSLPTASINFDATRNVLSEVLHRMHGDVPTLACARATNSRVNFMQRDMRQVDATRRDATMARLIVAQPSATHNCRVSSPRKRLALLSLRDVKMTDGRNGAGRGGGNGIIRLDERLSRVYYEARVINEVIR